MCCFQGLRGKVCRGVEACEMPVLDLSFWQSWRLSLSVLARRPVLRNGGMGRNQVGVTAASDRTTAPVRY